jgi:hypothetical protein
MYTLKWQHDEGSGVEETEVVYGPRPTGGTTWTGEPEMSTGWWIDGKPIPVGGLKGLPYSPGNIRWFFTHAIGFVNTRHGGWVELWEDNDLLYSHGVYEENKSFNPAPIMTTGKKDLGKFKKFPRTRRKVAA